MALDEGDRPSRDALLCAARPLRGGVLSARRQGARAFAPAAERPPTRGIGARQGPAVDSRLASPANSLRSGAPPAQRHAASEPDDRVPQVRAWEAHWRSGGPRRRWPTVGRGRSAARFRLGHARSVALGPFEADPESCRAPVGSTGSSPRGAPQQPRRIRGWTKRARGEKRTRGRGGAPGARRPAPRSGAAAVDGRRPAEEPTDEVPPESSSSQPEALERPRHSPAEMKAPHAAALEGTSATVVVRGLSSRKRAPGADPARAGARAQTSRTGGDSSGTPPPTVAAVGVDQGAGYDRGIRGYRNVGGSGRGRTTPCGGFGEARHQADRAVSKRAGAMYDCRRAPGPSARASGIGPSRSSPEVDLPQARGASQFAGSNRSR